MSHFSGPTLFHKREFGGVKSMLSCEEEQTNVVAEEAAPYQTKAEILASLDQACKELKLNLEGKLEFKSLDDALNEI